ncbi:glutathione S-transferase N-terminal domain-containing protein [Nitrospira japonica]|nr:glutathione S-transferase N-terminal domain-containing protein [Nitrospira japonica]
MLTLVQFPWSPFCITVRHILEHNGIPFRMRNIAYHERDLIITATKGRGHTVPCVMDAKEAVCDVTDFGQEVARYIDGRYKLNLFPEQFEGLQLILSRYIENDLEMVGFKVNDSHLIPTRPHGRTRHAHPSQRAEIRKGLCPGMDQPSRVSQRQILRAADPARPYPETIIISAQRSSAFRRLRPLRRAEQLFVQRKNEIPQSKEPPALVSGHE